MNISYKSLLLSTIVIFLISQNIFATNDLVARVPGNYTQAPAYIQNVTLVTEPHGGYVEQSMYLEYTDHGAFPGSQTVEIIHRFELPEGSVINDLWLWMGNNVMRAIMLDTWKARSIYDSIVSMKRDPAFLSKVGNQYELHVYPLVSGSSRKIKINFITPTKWFGANATCELPLRFLGASASTTLPVKLLFRVRDEIWGTPSISEIPSTIFNPLIDTLGLIYKSARLSDIKQLLSFNLAFTTNFTDGAFFKNNIVPRDLNYFQFGILPWQAFNITNTDTASKKVIAGIDLSGVYSKNYTTLIPNLKSAIKSGLKQNDLFNIVVAGAGQIKPLNSELTPYSPTLVDALIDNFVNSTYGDSIKQSKKPIIVYCDGDAATIWSFPDISTFADTKTFSSLQTANNSFYLADVVAAYDYGYEYLLSAIDIDKALKSLDSLFLRGGRFLAYYDLNRALNEKLATHYIPSIQVQYHTQETIHLSRNINGNIGSYFPESLMHGGGYFFALTDTTFKAELVDDQGYPCVISKKLGNGGLLVVTGLWPFNDDWSMRKTLGMPLLGLNSISTSAKMLTPLLNNYTQLNAANPIDRVITFSNTDSLTTTIGTDNWVNNYLTSFPVHPVFKSVNLLDGISVTPQSVTVNGKEYYGSGYLLQRLADITKGAHFETHLTDWPTITQLLSPSLHPYIDSIKLTSAFLSPQDSIKEFIEVNPNRADPERPLFFLGSTNSTTQVTLNADIWFSGIPDVKHTSFTYPFSIDTMNTLRVISSMLGFENLKGMFLNNSKDTAGIVSQALKYNLLCDYTGLIALEPNDTIHFMINPFDESVLSVKIESMAASQSHNNVTLSWTTSTETNNLGFDIERKTDNSVFVKVGFIQGKGTTTAKHSYSFTDNNLPSGSYTYRIKQIDVNGSIHYLKEINVEVGTPTVFSLEQNYPNPFNPSTTIKYQLPKAGFVTLRIYDILGREVVILVKENQNAGRYSVDFNASKLSSGIYIYELKSPDFTSCKKMILTK
jgi:Secretion system C-terminal sorting domain/Vault protein inter-alpha-trypsin domain